MGERRFSHLRWKDRLKIEKMLKEKRSVREIADALHVHNSTIYREIRRGMTQQRTTELVDVEVYCPETAQRKYQEGLQAKGPDLKIGADHGLAEYIEDKIINAHSRPAAVNERADAGHWEMDTVVSANKSKKRLLVLTERMTNYEIIELMPDGTTSSVVAALNRLERRFGARRFREIFRSVTVDNGSEFADCAGMEASCERARARTHIYYCHPYSAYERGSNEVGNRMIRRHLPKGTDFSKLTRQAVKEIEAWMNDYPRERLGWTTAKRAFMAAMEGAVRPV